MEKKRAISPLSTLFYTYIFPTSGVKLQIHLLNVVVQFIVFLTLSTLICRSIDISKSESLGIRDNRSRLYYGYLLMSMVNVLKFLTLYSIIFLPKFCILCNHFLKKLIRITKSSDPDQMDPSGAIWSGSPLFAFAILPEILVYEIDGIYHINNICFYGEIRAQLFKASLA